jgi:hypothetical protein
LISRWLALGVDYENLSGSSKSAKARELALYLWRHSKLPLLAAMGPKRRPDIDWGIVRPYSDPLAGRRPDANPREPEPQLPPDTTTEADAPKPPDKLNYTDLQRLIPIIATYPMFQTPDGRKTVLTLSGVDALVNVDLNGSARLVTSSLLVQLNEYGRTAEGDVALGRLLAFVLSDDALPPAHKEIIAAIVAKYGLA